MTILAWHCDKCGEPVADGAGWITIDRAALVDAERDYREWKLAHPGPALSGADLLALPEDIPWQVFHKRCDPDPDGAAYWWDIERSRTIPQLLEWWLHLSEKRWIGRTNWPAFIRQRVLPQLRAEARQ